MTDKTYKEMTDKTYKEVEDFLDRFSNFSDIENEDFIKDYQDKARTVLGDMFEDYVIDIFGFAFDPEYYDVRDAEKSLEDNTSFVTKFRYDESCVKFINEHWNQVSSMRRILKENCCQADEKEAKKGS